MALSERESEVITLIADGFTNPEIADQLQVAERTVKTYRARAIEKLGISSRAEITAYVRRSRVNDLSRTLRGVDQSPPAGSAGPSGARSSLSRARQEL